MEDSSIIFFVAIIYFFKPRRVWWITIVFLIVISAGLISIKMEHWFSVTQWILVRREERETKYLYMFFHLKK